MIRDNHYLENRLTSVKERLFSELPAVGSQINFGRRARTRLGSIKPTDNGSIITLNGLFKDETVPEKIIDLTIAHELCHYYHGFTGEQPRLFHYPHQGGIVDRELQNRGAGDDLKFQKKWLKEEWPKIIQINFGTKRRIRKRTFRRRPLSIIDLIFVR